MLKNNIKFFSTIKNIIAREAIDSRGFPTVETEIITDAGNFISLVPSGASTGIYEALELRDKNPNRYFGKGVLNAVNNVNNIIAKELIGKNVNDQFKLDKFMVEELDGSRNEYGWSKENLGANAILSVSLSLARAGAAANKLPLYEYISNLSGNNEKSIYMPIPCLNVINGGNHAGNKMPFQEFMLFPVGAPTFREGLRMGCETYQTLKSILKKKYGQSAINVGDEGGFAPDIQSVEEAIELLLEAIDKSGYSDKIKLGIDVAASEFYTEDKNYDLGFKCKEENKLNGDQMVKFYENIVNKYPIVSIEDPFDQNDFENWSKLVKSVGNKVQIVGDDLLVTNLSRIKISNEQKSCNSLLLKLNQIGSLSESIFACNYCQNNDWNVMISHRSGETEDNFIADLAVGLNAGQIKTGAPARSERISKYNRLLRIEDGLKNSQYYGGLVKYGN